MSELINPTDVLEIEVECITATAIVGERLYREGPNRLEVLAKELPIINQHLQTSEEASAMKAIRSQFHQRRDREFKSIDQKYNDEDTRNTMKEKWSSQNSFEKYYYEIAGSTYKPLRNYKLLGNRGPRIDDHQRRMEEEQNTKNMMLELMKKIVDEREDKTALVKILEKLVEKK